MPYYRTSTAPEVRIVRLDRLASGGYLLAFVCPDEEWFRATVAALKRSVPLGGREWVPDEKAWWIDSRYLSVLARLFANAREWMPGAAGGETGSAGGHHQSRHRRTSGDREAPADVAAAFEGLYLRLGAPPHVVRAVYRALVKDAHPDAGGNHQAMIRLGSDYERALAWAESHHTQHGKGAA